MLPDHDSAQQPGANGPAFRATDPKSGSAAPHTVPSSGPNSPATAPRSAARGDHHHQDTATPLAHHVGEAVRIGIGGPVGSGKTALVAALCRTLRPQLEVAVVTNDIYTTEDADYLLRNGVLPQERVRAVETGACPHTAIRDDISANLDALDELESAHPSLDLVLLESGGDNLTATFSRGLIHRQVFVLDVSGGDKVPRKGGPGVTTADLLVINKTDLADQVGADLDVMDRDARARRGELPVMFTSLTRDPAVVDVATWVQSQLPATAP